MSDEEFDPESPVSEAELEIMTSLNADGTRAEECPIDCTCIFCIPGA